MNQESICEEFLIGFDEELQSFQARLQALDGMPKYQSYVSEGVLKVRKVWEDGTKFKGKPNYFPIIVLDFKHSACPHNSVFECNGRAFNSIVCSRWSSLSQGCTDTCQFNYFDRASLANHISRAHAVQNAACSLCNESFNSLHHVDRHFHEQHNLEGDLCVCIHQNEKGERCGHLFRRKEKYMAHCLGHWKRQASGCCEPAQGVDYITVDILIFIAAVWPAKKMEARQFKSQQLQLALKQAPKAPPTMPLGVKHHGHHGIERMPQSMQELEQMVIQAIQKAALVASEEGEAAARRFLSNRIGSDTSMPSKKRIRDEPAFRKVHRQSDDDDDDHNSESTDMSQRMDLANALYMLVANSSETSKTQPNNHSNSARENQVYMEATCETPPREHHCVHKPCISPSNQPKLVFDKERSLLHADHSKKANMEIEAEDDVSTLAANVEDPRNDSEVDDAVWAIVDGLVLEPYLAHLDDVSHRRSREIEDDISTIPLSEREDDEVWSILDDSDLYPYLAHMDGKSCTRSTGFDLVPSGGERGLFTKGLNWGSTTNRINNMAINFFPEETNIQSSAVQTLPPMYKEYQELDLVQAFAEMEVADEEDFPNDRNDIRAFRNDVFSSNPKPFNTIC